jgi:hypothetical protein
MSKQQKAEMEHGLEAAGLLDRPVEEKENLVAKQLAYLASDFPHSRLLENQALYRSVLEKNCPKQGLSLSEPDMVTLKRNYLITVKKCATIYTIRLC